MPRRHHAALSFSARHGDSTAGPPHHNRVTHSSGATLSPLAHTPLLLSLLWLLNLCFASWTFANFALSTVAACKSRWVCILIFVPLYNTFVTVLVDYFGVSVVDIKFFSLNLLMVTAKCILPMPRNFVEYPTAWAPWICVVKK